MSITLERLAGVPWVLNYDTRTAFTPAQQHLRLLGVEPRAAVVVESFAAIPFFVVGHDPGRHGAAPAGPPAGADWPTWSTSPCRSRLSRLVESLWWHPARGGDPAHAWLRSVLRTVGRKVAEQPAR